MSGTRRQEGIRKMRTTILHVRCAECGTVMNTDEPFCSAECKARAINRNT